MDEGGGTRGGGAGGGRGLRVNGIEGREDGGAREGRGRGGGGVGGHTQHLINVEDINKEKHTYSKAADLRRLF